MFLGDKDLNTNLLISSINNLQPEDIYLKYIAMLGYVARIVKRIFKSHWRRILVFLAGFVFAICCFISLNAVMGPFSKSEYCGSKCHEMNITYLTWELSPHGSNKRGLKIGCIDCHLPPKDQYFNHVTAKAYEGARDMYHHYLGHEYDREKIRKRVLQKLPSKICLRCHNSLLANPVSSAARMAHTASLTEPENPDKRCVKCHENVGHERENKLFRP